MTELKAAETTKRNGKAVKLTLQALGGITALRAGGQG